MSRPPVTLQGDAAGSGGSWIDAAVDQHATVVALGALCADVAEVEIVLWLRAAAAIADGYGPDFRDLIRRMSRAILSEARRGSTANC